MVKSADCLPTFGVYQALRWDSARLLDAVATIAHAGAIDYLTSQGVDHNLIAVRPGFGFTFSSHRDTTLATTKLAESDFDALTFKQVVETLPPPDYSPLIIGSAYIGNQGRPKYAGINVHRDSMAPLYHQATAIQKCALIARGDGLPIRHSFRHVSLFAFMGGITRPTLERQQVLAIRDIISNATEEVGLKEIYLGKIVVGSDISHSLPESAFL